MRFLMWMLVLLLFLMVFFGYHLIRYRNPYKLIMVFGKKGSGKTTLMVKLSLRFNRKGRPVYCNVRGIPGTYYFDTRLVGIVGFPPDSVVMVDEVGMVWDNRDYKNFDNKVRDYFKLQRHYKHTVYLFSQSFDIDKKLRDLTDNMYLVGNFMNCISVARRIAKKITISHGDRNTQGESKLIDDMKFEPVFLFFLGTVRLTYIPKFTRYFDSYEAPVLQQRQFTFTPIPEMPGMREVIVTRIRSLQLRIRKLPVKIMCFISGRCKASRNALAAKYQRRQLPDALDREDSQESPPGDSACS